jgi:hypothetical protein
MPVSEGGRAAVARQPREGPVREVLLPPVQQCSWRDC